MAMKDVKKNISLGWGRGVEWVLAWKNIFIYHGWI